MNPPPDRPKGPRPLIIPSGMRRPQPDTPAEPPPPLPPEETRLAGWNAVAAAFERRPDAILRLFFDEATGKRCGAWCSNLAASRRIYRQVPRDELERIAGTVHHGGIVAVVPAEPIPELDRRDAARWSADGQPLVILDRVANPHNVGLIARTAAFLGFPRILLGDGAPNVLPDPVWRLAEGGLEWVACVRASPLAPHLASLRANFLLLGATPGPQSRELDAVDWRRLRKPVALVLGNEETGLSGDVLRACETRIAIRGSGRVDSLNVAAAAAILLHDLRSRLPKT